MNRQFAFAGVLVSLSMLSGCASMPNVKSQYFLPKSETKLVVTQTVACDAKSKNLIFGHSAVPTTTYSPDPARPESFSFQSIDGSFADASIGFTFTDDGRLKGINTTSTGQGEAVIKAAVSVASVALAAGASADAPLPPCKAIEQWGGKDKVVTITYNATVSSDAAKQGTNVDFHRIDDNADVYAALKDKLPALTLQVYAATELPSGIVDVDHTAVDPKVSQSSLTLRLNRVSRVTLKIFAAYNPAVAAKEIWSGDVLMPAATEFDLPIPKALLFGTNSVSLTLNDAGGITAATYGKTTGATGALNSVQTVGAVVAPSDADRAAAYKADADRIAQQKRDTKCRADPDACSS